MPGVVGDVAVVDSGRSTSHRLAGGQEGGYG